MAEPYGEFAFEPFEPSGNRLRRGASASFMASDTRALPLDEASLWTRVLRQSMVAMERRAQLARLSDVRIRLVKVDGLLVDRAALTPYVGEAGSRTISPDKDSTVFVDFHHPLARGWPYEFHVPDIPRVFEADFRDYDPCRRIVGRFAMLSAALSAR